MITTQTNVDAKRLPWPGPRPYDEEHWDCFYGRDSEIKRLLGRIQVERLTILLGGSGTGKTSLIRAGVVPMLRHERYHPDGEKAVWPVLLFRRWGSRGSTTLEESLFQQLELAINAIEAWGQALDQERALQDAKELRSALAASRDAGPGRTGLLEVIEALAKAQARQSRGSAPRSDEGGQESGGGGGLVLVFDQFEEQLRAGSEAASEALRLITNLVRSAAPTRVLLSMRQEFRYALRGLENALGGLSGRSIYLTPLKEPAVVEIVQEASNSSEVSIDGDVATRVVGWLAPRSQDASTPPQSVTGEDQGGAQANRQQDELGRPDLLQLQAVLLELCHFALGRNETRMTMPLFDRFVSEFGKDSERVVGESKESARARRVLGGALERWIEAAIRNEVKDGNGAQRSIEGKSPSHARWAKMESDDLTRQVHRVAVRLAPRLSSADYKVSQEENTLFRQAMGEEISKLGIKDLELYSKIRITEGGEGSGPTLNWKELRLSQELDKTAQRTLSGQARVKGWSPAETGNQIVVCFKETLDRLADANILQRTTFGTDERRSYWELVHDQFGPSFTKWAERQKGTWDDCKNSLVVCSGLQPIVVPVSLIEPLDGSDFYELLRITWQGCGIETSRPERLTLRKVRFRECYLVGTIFDAVDFVGCSFERCDLKGGLFRDCTFQADDDEKPTRFEECDANIAIVRGGIYALEFSNCHLLQPTIDGSSLDGEIVYTRGSRVIQGYFDVKRGEGENVRISFIDGSRAVLCLASDNIWEIFKVKDSDLDIRNSPLISGFKVRP
jgi:hypothetical protein